VLSGPAIQRINDSVIKKLIILNTIDLSSDSKQSDKFTILSVAPILAEAIKRIYEDISVSKLFEDV
jgi:ribose-phosphate pyrophosphokinase